MTSQYKWLHIKINDYLDYLSKPNPDLNSWAPCPWIKPYRNRITIHIAEQGIKQPCLLAIQQHHEQNLAASIVAFPKKPPHGTILKVTDSLLTANPDLEILAINHRLTGAYRGIDTAFPWCDLIIVQNSRILENARSNLRSRGYYRKLKA